MNKQDKINQLGESNYYFDSNLRGSNENDEPLFMKQQLTIEDIQDLERELRKDEDLILILDDKYDTEANMKETVFRNLFKWEQE